MSKRDKILVKQIRLENLWHLVAGFIVIVIAFFMGSIFIRLIFRLIGTPSSPWDDLLSALFSGLLGFTILIVGFLVVARLVKAHQLRALQRMAGVSPYDRTPGDDRFGDRSDRRRDFTEFFGRDIFDALERIARGDFNVFVPSHEHDPLAGLAESVNRMARQLGTVESQRQQFITDVSHEIQSPLTSISGFAALLRDSALTEEQRLHYLGIIEQESRRLSHLADNLLRLAALDSEDQQAERTHYALDEQLRSVILTLEPQWTARNVSVELVTEQTKPNTDADIKAAESEPEVNREAAGSEPGANPGSTEYGATPLAFDGDQELMEQVWINLIGNAIKFTPEGGKVTVSVERVGAAWVVRVIDTGIGVTEEDLLHIFERFYRADKARGRSQGGNGLGLPLARRIVELHGGSIDVASDPDHGSTFTVTL